MASVSFKGNIGKVRDIQFGQDGQARFGFSVAEGHGKFDKQTQQWQDTGTTWWAVTVFGRQAEALAEVIREGAKQRVVVSGRSSTREYEANGETRTSLDVIADSVGVIPSNPQNGQNGPQGGFQGQGGGNTRPNNSRPSQGQQGDPWGKSGQQSYDWSTGNDQDPPY